MRQDVAFLIGFVLCASPAVSEAAEGEIWSGPFVSFDVGAGLGPTQWVMQVPFFADRETDHDSKGAVLGAGGGYRWQSENWVYGLQADIAATSLRGSDRCPGADWTCGSELEWLASIRGQLGYTRGNWLIFGTAGIAAGAEKIFVEQAPDHSADTEINSGYVVGAGIEYALDDRWSLKGEYLHYDFGRRHYTLGGDIRHLLRFDVDTLRVGVGYRF